jgi:hypothetical protein
MAVPLLVNRLIHEVATTRSYGGKRDTSDPVATFSRLGFNFGKREHKFISLS